jgi:hypothetical protein
MSARHRKARVVLADLSVDLGPAIRLRTIVDAAGHELRPATAVLSEWLDPSDDNPMRRAAKTVAGARAANPLANMAARSGLVTLAHLAAAERLSSDAELVGGAAPGRGNPWMRLSGATVAGAGVSPSERALAATSRVRAAMAAIGDERSRSLVGHVLGFAGPERRDVASWARGNGMSAPIATGMLVAALDRLSDYYAGR